MADYSNSQIPSTNVKVTDVNSTLGAGSYVLSTLCKSSIINFMSKWKPYVSNVTTATEADLLDKNCGITIPQVSTLGDAPVGGGAWTYTKPSGGSSSPYRLGDFRNYAHKASTCWKWGVNGNEADQFYKAQSWSSNTDFAVIFYNVKDITKEVVGTLHLDDVVKRGNSINNGTYNASNLYIWVAIIAPNGTFLKRSEKSIAELYEGDSIVEVINYKLQSDFSGNMRYISSVADVYAQIFIGNATSSNMQTNANLIVGRLSLNTFGNGYDRQKLGNAPKPMGGVLELVSSTPTSSKNATRITFNAYSYSVKNNGTYDCTLTEDVQISIASPNNSAYLEGTANKQSAVLNNSSTRISQKTTKTFNVAIPNIILNGASYCAVTLTIGGKIVDEGVIWIMYSTKTYNLYIQ